MIPHLTVEVQVVIARLPEVLMFYILEDLKILEILHHNKAEFLALQGTAGNIVGSSEGAAA